MFSPELDALLAQLTSYGFVESHQYRDLFTDMADGIVVTDAVRQAVLCAMVNSLVPNHFLSIANAKSKLDELTDEVKDSLPAIPASTASQLTPALTQAVTETYSLFKVALEAAHEIKPEPTNKAAYAGRIIRGLIKDHVVPLESTPAEELES